MRHRMAASVATISLFVFTTATPGFATHAEPDAQMEGNIQSCTAFGFDVDWEQTQNQPQPIDHEWFTGTVTDDLLRFNVEWKPGGEEAADQAGLTLVVLVKGGDMTNAFVEPRLTDLFAPVNASGDHAEISNYTICKVTTDSAPPPPPPEPEPTEPEPTPTEEPTPEPTSPTPAPVPVPTSVLGGVGGPGQPSAGNGLADESGGLTGVAGFVLVGTLLAAGTVLLVRRRLPQHGA